MSDIDITSAVTDEAFDSALDLPETDTPDVGQTDPAADQPATPSETVVDAPETPDTEEAEKPSDETAEPVQEEPETPASTTDTDSSLNWQSAPEQFREEYQKVKKELVAGNTLKEKFFEGPESFLTELSGLSTSQFQQTTQEIVKKGIEAMPDDFAAYMAEVAPQSLAKAIAGKSPELLADALDLGMPLDKAKKIIEQVKRQDLESYLNDNDESDAPIAPEKAAKPESEKLLRPEDVEKIVEERLKEAGKPQKVEALKERTYADIMKPVEDALEEAGLKALPTDSAEDKQFKEWAAARIIKDTFEYLLDNEKNAAQSKKLIEMIEALDEAGVKHLSPIAAIKAEDYALQQIAMLTTQRAKAKTKPTEPKKTPPKTVPSSGSVAAFGNTGAAVKPIADLSEADFESVGI
jgi:hypothetical protein